MMKRKQVKLSSFLAPDGKNVHEKEPKKEIMANNWSQKESRDELIKNKKRVLPSSITGPKTNLDSNYSALKSVSTFRPPDRIGQYDIDTKSNALIASNKASKSVAIDDITLSISQKKVLDTIIARKSVFFTGAAGTGKSYILKIMRDVLETLGLSEKVSFTAPTGVAACNIRGLTIHSWAGVGMAVEPKDQLAALVGRNRVAAQHWRDCEILVIDEISMLSAELFDKLSFIGSRVRNDPRPFGGIQLVLCGDFFQLPPIGVGKNSHFCFESESWNQIFGGREDGMIVLDKVFRQQNDTVFLNILNDLRMGVVTTQAQRVLGGKVQQSYLKDREEKETAMQISVPYNTTTSTSSSSITSSKEANTKKPFVTPTTTTPTVRPTKLFSTNKDVDSYNSMELEKLAQLYPDSEEVRYEAVDEGREPYLNQLRQGMKAPAVLVLRAGAQVMLLKNLSTARGLVNGARGTVVGFEKSANRTANTAFIPVVRFQVYLGSTASEETISVDQESWDIKQGERVLASRVQIPLMLAWAISIHKSQGMTIPLLEVSFNRIFEYGQGYVALSRATCLEGLTLRSFQVSSIKAHNKVCEFYEKICAKIHQKSSISTHPETSDQDQTTISAKISEFAKAFVLEVPVIDNANEWLDSRNMKSTAATSNFKKVVAVYKAGVHNTTSSTSNNINESNERTLITGAVCCEDDEDDALMFTAPDCTPPNSRSVPTSAIGTGNPSQNRFQQFNLTNTTNAANDWLDDEPTAAQRFAAQNAYSRQYQKATTTYGDRKNDVKYTHPSSISANSSNNDIRVNTISQVASSPSRTPAADVSGSVYSNNTSNSTGISSRAHTQVYSSPSHTSIPATTPGAAEPTKTTTPFPVTGPFSPPRSTTTSNIPVEELAASPVRAATLPGPFSSPFSHHTVSLMSSPQRSLPVALPHQQQQSEQSLPRPPNVTHTEQAAAPPQQHQQQPTSLMNILQPHRSYNTTTTSSTTTTATAAAIAPRTDALGHLPEEVKKRIEQNRIAALQRLQENRRRREEETSKLMQEYKI